MGDFLDGKKTYIAGFLVALISLLSAFGVKLPFDPSKVTVDAILSGLGILVMVARAFASKPGVLAKPSA